MPTVTDEQIVLVRVSNAQVQVVPEVTPDVTIMEAGKHTIVLKGKCAETVKAHYAKFRDPRSDKRTLKITLEIEVPQPLGKFVG